MIKDKIIAGVAYLALQTGNFLKSNAVSYLLTSDSCLLGNSIRDEAEMLHLKSAKIIGRRVKYK